MTRLAVIVTVVLLVSAGVGAGSVPPASTSQPGFDSESSAAGGLNGDAVDSESDDAVVHPELENASGSRTVVVRLSDADHVATAASSRRHVSALKRSAERAQRDVVLFARKSPNAELRNQFWLANALLLKVEAGTGVVDRLAAQDGVERVHPNFRVAAQATQSTPAGAATMASGRAVSSPNATDGVELVNATEVWTEFGTRGEGETIAVLDTGVDPDHPDIDLYRRNQSDLTYPGGWAEFDPYGDRVPDSRPNDANGHGTHVAGIATGGNASSEYIGVAPDSRLIVGKALDDYGYGSFARILASMQWAVERDADVLALSLGVEGHHAEFVEPVRNAEAAGSHVVASTGRFGPGASGSPANVHEAIAVGAVDRRNDVLSTSGGEVVDVDEEWGEAAPGDWPDNYTVPDVVAPREPGSQRGDRWRLPNGEWHLNGEPLRGRDGRTDGVGRGRPLAVGHRTDARGHCLDAP